MFLLDFVFKLDVVQRTVAASAGFLMLVWYLRRTAWPYLKMRDSALQTALDVERIHGIDSHLVAALQFETPDDARRSSPQLEQAVIQAARAVSQDLDTFAGFRFRPTVRRLLILSAAVIGITVAATSLPRHASAFLKRLVWQPARYPTETVVQNVVINGQIVLKQARDDTQPRPLACPEGAPVEFSVQTTGAAPEQGILRLAGPDGQPMRTISLTPDRDAPINSSGDRGTRAYHGTLRRLVTPLTYQIYLGDTWTDSAEIDMIARPKIDLAARVQPPRYTGVANSVERSVRQLSVLEGSQVGFQLSSTNGKRIRTVELSWEAGSDVSSHRFVQADGAGFEWVLRPEQTVFADLQDELRFEVQVTDEDGLGLERPLSGIIVVQKDRPPSVAIRSIHRVVLPDAEPVIDFQIVDDFAIDSAVLHVRSNSVQPGTTTDVDPDPDASREFSRRFEIPIGDAPIAAERLPLDGQYALDLARFALQKDDQLTLTLEVMDGRGDTDGASSYSEPLILQITDEQGVLAAISQADERAERDLSEIIRRQLEVGQR